MNKYKKGFKRYINWVERNRGIKTPTNYESEYYDIFVEVCENMGVHRKRWIREEDELKPYIELQKHRMI